MGSGQIDTRRCPTGGQVQVLPGVATERDGDRFRRFEIWVSGKCVGEIVGARTDFDVRQRVDRDARVTETTIHRALSSASDGAVNEHESAPGANSFEICQSRQYDKSVPSLRVLIEQPTKGKRWVAVAADWPGLERGAKTEDEAVEKLARYLPRYLPVAKRAGLDSELATQTDLDIIGRYPGTGSTDFWGISFAPSPLDREPFDEPTFDRSARLLRGAWAEFDETAARVSAELRPGVRGGGRSRDRIVTHVLAQEAGDFSRRVKAMTEVEDIPNEELIHLTPDVLDRHRDRFVEAMRDWYAEGKPLGKWTVPYLLRHTAYHVLDHAWEMQDRDLTGDASAE